MTRFVCIHGHFYQPPRQDPWTDHIDRQPSALPFKNWNERIAAECYGPNAAAHIIGKDGHVSLHDNYRWMNFNFGPTLHQWLDDHHPALGAHIADADLQHPSELDGVRCGGIAQAWGHTILPLANRRDKKTQIRWGIADFAHRFQRQPAGMGLPEAAVDIETLECLAEEDIAFTVLPPSQAARIRKTEPNASWRPFDPETDTRKSTVCHLPSGKSIALFFYDGAISQQVAFDGLLHNGDRLAHALKTACMNGEPGDLLSIATDGETYGHHHRHGEMALAWCIQRFKHDPEITLTSFEHYLSTHPPVHEVEIHPVGSWSCAHGVERWRSDCGCQIDPSSGWSQAWRTPLRGALDQLNEALSGPFERAANRYVQDPWKARDDEALVAVGAMSREQFVQIHQRNDLTKEEVATVEKLYQLQRNLMAMFTSCGWFFDDIAGIEAQQVLAFAGRAIVLAEELFGQGTWRKDLLNGLSAAKSNKLGGGTASTILAGILDRDPSRRQDSPAGAQDEMFMTLHRQGADLDHQLAEAWERFGEDWLGDESDLSHLPLSLRACASSHCTRVILEGLRQHDWPKIQDKLHWAKIRKIEVDTSRLRIEIQRQLNRPLPGPDAPNPDPRAVKELVSLANILGIPLSVWAYELASGVAINAVGDGATRRPT